MSVGSDSDFGSGGPSRSPSFRGGRTTSEERAQLEAAGRVPPADLDAEKAVLSSIMIDNDSFHVVFDHLKPEDFYHPAHQVLYQAMIDLRDSSQPVDLVVLADHLTAGAQLEAIGGVATLGDIADFEATSANAEHYAKIVRDKSIKRNLIHVASEIVAAGFDAGEDAAQLLDTAESRIFELSQVEAKSTLAPLDQAMGPAFDHIEMLMTRGGDITGVSTGLKAFDAMTGGLQPGDLVILAARPSMGKTALALNFARNAALDYEKRVAVFSLEMTTRSLVLRLPGRGWGFVRDVPLKQRLVEVCQPGA